MFRSYAQAGISAGASAPSSQSAGGVAAPGGWHPTVLYMLGLVVAEIVVAGFLSRHLLS